MQTKYMRKLACAFVLVLLLLALPLGASAAGATPIDAQNDTYLIYYDARGGTGIPVIGYTSTTGKISEIPIPAMSGYTFVGWYTDEIDGDKITVNTVFTADTTLYARWVADTSSTTSTATSTSTSTAAQQSTTPAKAGFDIKDHMGTVLVLGTVAFVVAYVAMVK